MRTVFVNMIFSLLLVPPVVLALLLVSITFWTLCFMARWEVPSGISYLVIFQLRRDDSNNMIMIAGTTVPRNLSKRLLVIDSLEGGGSESLGRSLTVTVKVISQGHHEGGAVRRTDLGYALDRSDLGIC